jgi:hypothetical protein
MCTVGFLLFLLATTRITGWIMEVTAFEGSLYIYSHQFVPQEMLVKLQIKTKNS